MDKPVARIDQPVAIHLVLSNNSSSPVAMMDLWAPHVNYELYLHDTQGKEAPLSDLGRKLRTNPTGGSADRLVLAPGDKFEMDEDLSKIYSVSVPGSYTVEACRQIMNWGNIYSNKLVIPFTH